MHSEMAQIDAAMAYLKAQKKANFAEAARRFEIDPMTLRRRFLGLCGSREQANSERRQLLNNVQEDVLLGYIDKLTAKFIPPTTQIIRNLAEELIGGSVGKNWAAGFVERHKNRICSKYLRPLDRARVYAEKASVFEHFYELVLYLLC
jgi:Tc5 transposase DNA-binding domain